MLTTLKGPVAEKEESEARPGTGRAERAGSVCKVERSIEGAAEAPIGTAFPVVRCDFGVARNGKNDPSRTLITTGKHDFGVARNGKNDPSGTLITAGVWDFWDRLGVCHDGAGWLAGWAGWLAGGLAKCRYCFYCSLGIYIFTLHPSPEP